MYSSDGATSSMKAMERPLRARPVSDSCVVETSRGGRYDCAKLSYNKYPNSLRIPYVNYLCFECQQDISHPCTTPQRLSTIPKEANLVPHKGIILGAAPSRRRAYLCKKEWRSELLSHLSHDWTMTKRLSQEAVQFLN